MHMMVDRWLPLFNDVLRVTCARFSSKLTDTLHLKLKVYNVYSIIAKYYADIQ